MIIRNLKRILKSVIVNTLHFFGYKIEKFKNREVADNNFERSFHLVSAISTDSNRSLVLELVSKSSSQLGQDIFVLSQCDFKSNGYYVEFGASDGVKRSNTLLLEEEFGWTGILAEPCKQWHKPLRNSRPGSIIETDCVWHTTGDFLVFNETSELELSTIDKFSHGDIHSKKRKSTRRYRVKTISLRDLLRKHNAPTKIDYLSIDTEGSEFEILSAFDFSEYDIQLITVEHNFSENRERIFDLLVKHGFNRVFENNSSFDDWYVRDCF